MYRTQWVLALLALSAGLAHPLSWDIVVARYNGLEFYIEDILTYPTLSRIFLYPTSDISIAWMTYDPSHNRVLFSNKFNDGKCINTFNIATRKPEPLMKNNPCRGIDPESYVYDPATGLLFGTIEDTGAVYSFLIKSGSNNEVGDGNLVMNSRPAEFAVENCGGYIYWTTYDKSNRIERARFNGSDKEIIIDGGSMYRHALTIDSQTQKMYFCENEFDYLYRTEFYLVSADLDGKNRKILYQETDDPPNQLILSKDFIYWTFDKMSIWQLPKNPPNDTNMKTIQFLIDSTPGSVRYIAANYKIEEQTQGIPLCKPLKSVLSNYSATNDSFNVSTEVNQPLTNEMIISGESRDSERCDDSVWQYYCFQGDCTISAEGRPTCRCNAGYSGPRCEVYVCQAFCLNDGVCSLNEKSEPICRCPPRYKGDRCEVSISQPKCFEELVTETASLLTEILHEDH